MNLYLHTSGCMHDKALDVDRPWRDRVRSQIFCRNQEEKDYLYSLNLMHGREIEVNIWDEWLAARAARPGTLHTLPIAYTTWPIKLRGY